MKFPESWLRTLVNPPISSSELAHSLTMAGLEVEAIESAAPDFNKVVVAEILSIKKQSQREESSFEEKIIDVLTLLPWYFAR